jgi:uncharacterized protein YbjT (DUF2867 family)
MLKMLITGATGNIGKAIVKQYTPKDGQKLYLATRKKEHFAHADQNPYLYFDFDHQPESYECLTQIDVLFLLRPPHISDVKKYFQPLIEACKRANIKHILFLSVQGADTASFIPHAKIEKIIRNSGITYTFVRPAYFMQNLSTTLQTDIVQNNRIFLPAGKARFNWIDVEDIGLAIARILENLALHENKIYTITGPENLNFGQAAAYLSEVLQRKITYISPGIIRFYFIKKREGVPVGFILVMILLHFLPRFGKEPEIHSDCKQLTGHKPHTLREFIGANKSCWQTKSPAHS